MVLTSTCTGDTLCKIRLVGHVINLVMWRFLKKSLISKLRNNQLTKLITSYIISFYQRLLVVQVSTWYSYHRWKFRFSLLEPVSLCEKCPNTEFFLVLIFPHSDQKKLRIWTLVMQCMWRKRHVRSIKVSSC